MLISLTTDFGLSDAYAGVMKGVILSINPEAQIVDLTHGILPRQIEQAAFVLHANYPFFPDDTIHVAVVDPGVGTQREALGVRTSKAIFIAPDNGVLKYIFDAHPDAEVYKLNQSGYWLHPASQTFHGRDIFAPVAGHVSRGVALSEMGVRFESFDRGRVIHPEIRQDEIIGAILYFDHFGNAVTNLDRSLLRGVSVRAICVNDLKVDGVQHTYADVPPGEPVACIGSAGTLEIGVNQGSARVQCGLQAGNRVAVRVRGTG